MGCLLIRANRPDGIWMSAPRATLQRTTHRLRGGVLDVHWPQIPVAHLAFETDAHFYNIDCLRA